MLIATDYHLPEMTESGAGPGDVVRMVLRQSSGIIATGVVAGVAAAFAAGRVLQRLVDGMRSTDPWTLVDTISILVGAAMLASLLPARRASRVDPTIALRQE